MIGLTDLSFLWILGKTYSAFFLPLTVGKAPELVRFSDCSDIPFAKFASPRSTPPSLFLPALPKELTQVLPRAFSMQSRKFIPSLSSFLSTCQLFFCGCCTLRFVWQVFSKGHLSRVHAGLLLWEFSKVVESSSNINENYYHIIVFLFLHFFHHPYWSRRIPWFALSSRILLHTNLSRMLLRLIRRQIGLYDPTTFESYLITFFEDDQIFSRLSETFRFPSCCCTVRTDLSAFPLLTIL